MKLDFKPKDELLLFGAACFILGFLSFGHYWLGIFFFGGISLVVYSSNMSLVRKKSVVGKDDSGMGDGDFVDLSSEDLASEMGGTR